jgi:hypothetical protein
MEGRRSNAFEYLSNDLSCFKERGKISKFLDRINCNQTDIQTWQSMNT